MQESHATAAFGLSEVSHTAKPLVHQEPGWEGWVLEETTKTHSSTEIRNEVSKHLREAREQVCGSRSQRRLLELSASFKYVHSARFVRAPTCSVLRAGQMAEFNKMLGGTAPSQRVGLVHVA